MPRIEQSYPSPIHGVSTLAPRTRPQGYASQQVNFRSDPVNKLTRRPASLYRQLVTGAADVNNVQYHSYERGGKEYSFIVDKTSGIVHCAVDDVIVNTVSLGAYNGSDLGLFTIEHETYILNRDKVVATLTDNDSATIEKVSHVNIKSALNYGEIIQINITDSLGVRTSVSYEVPELGVTDPDFDAADKARATKQVALEIAVRINGGGSVVTPTPNPDYPTTDPYADPIWVSTCADPSDILYNPLASKCVAYDPIVGATYPGIVGITAVALGSTVAIYEDARGEWLQVEVESGQGDRTSVAINQIIESTDGLPLYAVVGTRITVRPDPTSDKGIYYLQAERISDDPTGEVLEEVVWSEDRHPTQTHSLDTTTLPHKITYDGNNFVFGVVPYRARKTGDHDSTPFPEFVGETIQSMGYFQKRLVVIAENAVYMTETEDLLNWFRQSAVQLLVTDPIGVTTSELGADKILHLVPHNKDLLCITSNSQFKISGSEAITPETVSMPLTTKYECQTSVSPVTIGNSVYFPIDYGDSTGVQEYTGERDTSQDFAAPITNHIIGYLTGTAELMAASPNLEMIAMTTTNSVGNKLFIYEQYTDKEGKRSQQSWSEWVVGAPDDNIVDIKFRRNELILLVAKGSDLVVVAVPMYTRVTTSPTDVYLDDMLILATDGLTVTVPTGYDMTDKVIVRGSGTLNELWKVQYTGTTVLTFNEDINAGFVYVGRPFTSLYEPTRPFRYDEDGTTITTDRIRVSHWILSLVDTNSITMVKTADFSDPVEIQFKSVLLNTHELGTIGVTTGDEKFSFAEDAANAVATFTTDSYLGCTISDVSWEGQYFQTKKRMK